MIASLADRVAVVTGGNSGVGLEVVRGLVSTGHRVVLACRDIDRGRAASRAVAASLPSRSNDEAVLVAERIDVLPLNLSSLASIRAFAARVRDRYDGIGALVNNAGLVKPGGGLSADGHELHFAVMHLGHFELTRLLLDLLRRGQTRSGRPSRVVSVSAWGHRLAKPDFDAVRRADPNAFRAYCRAKLAQVVSTRAWAKQIPENEVAFFSLHPGIVRTNLAGDLGGLAQRTFELIAVTAAASAQLPLYLAQEPDLERWSGEYFSYRTFQRSFGHAPSRASRYADDPALQRRLRTLSEELSRV
ncbi:MAG TPA: SDR family NAD(P)-dependent oxidoreductase [Microvirga sp.]|nr:SDR family NAD(P)-dependent oxidoreductase [Microvirga sp.]